ncbi:agamous-like MADS-box protein AGL61 [Silene latifolia]|uniref:agamous-like MADS-box protein AGL61 n=1 Tax=Silene latifolia TaxID=37657 RepID=UPI003D76F207
MALKKESRGRQKIKMVKIKNPSHRQVTFSKRRLGLFKKASEICTLCGVEVFIIVYSPGQKIFSFGYPDVDSLVDRFLSRNTSSQMSAGTSIQSEATPQSPNLRDLNSQLTRITDLLEAEKNRGEMFNNMRKSSQCWWEAPIDKLGLQELEMLGASLENLKTNIASLTMFSEKDNNNGIEVPQHFDLKSLEAKVEGFCLPHLVNNFHPPNFC